MSIDSVKEIKSLKCKIDKYESEREQMIENFKASNSVLLERIKELEGKSHLGERPQTAQVLSNISINN